MEEHADIVSVDNLIGVYGLEAASVAARLCRRFYVRDWDQRFEPFTLELEGMTVIAPLAGLRLWIYLAQIPLDASGEDRGDLNRDRKRLVWAASKNYPEGELGTMPLTPDSDYSEISRKQFALAAMLVWPDYPVLTASA